ncbi:MAG: hypothetical protein AAF432_12465 [Planctomycetota bacterium]
MVRSIDDLTDPERSFKLGLIHITLFIALGIIAMTCWSLRVYAWAFFVGEFPEFSLAELLLQGNVVAAFIAAGVGICVTPWILARTRDKPAKPIVRRIYRRTILVVAAYALLISPYAIDCAIPASISAIVTARSAARQIADFNDTPLLCERCSYDLRGAKHANCPECGLSQTPTTQRM